MKEVFYENSRVRCVLEFALGRVFLHLRVKKWGKTTARLIADRFVLLRQMLLELGHENLFVYFPASDARIERMARRHGFTEIRRNPQWVVMERQNA